MEVKIDNKKKIWRGWGQMPFGATQECERKHREGSGRTRSFQWSSSNSISGCVCVCGGGVGGFFSSSLGVSAPPDRVRSGTITMRRELASLNVKHRGVCGSARVSSCIKIQVLPRHWC